MTNRRVLLTLIGPLLATFAGTGCGSDPLQKLVEQDITQIVLPPARTVSMNVNYCTLPTQKRAFPTRFVVIFDRSGSNQECTAAECGVDIPGTDPDASRRFGGMAAFVQSLSADQQNLYSFSLIDFSADPATYGSTSDPGISTADMDRGQTRYGHSFMTTQEFGALLAEPLDISPTQGRATGEKNPYNESASVPQDGGWTDYLLALKQAYQLIYQEVVPTPPSLFNPNPPQAQDAGQPFAYVVIFVSDGAPIVNGKLAPPYVLNSTGPPLDYREPWADPLAPTDIKRAVARLMSLNQQSNVIGMSINTIYYSAPGVPQDVGTGCAAPSETCSPCLAGDPSCTPNGLLDQMAVSGSGQFLDYTAGGIIDFTRITLPSMDMSSNLVAFYANDRNAVWWKGQLLQDSDGDGLPDMVETSLGYNPAQVSTQGNGISDWVNYRVCNGVAGCSLTSLIASKCVPPTVLKNSDGTWADSDGDGLNDCEEALLGSDPQNPDSNADNLPDGLAAFHGVPFLSTDPSCASLDPDLDGLNDCEETRLNTPVDVPNSSIIGLVPYVYTVLGTQPSGSSLCYTIRVDNVSTLTDHDQLRFLGVEQPNQFQTQVVVRTATKAAQDDVINYTPEDFP